MGIEIFIDIETLPTARHDIQARCWADIAPPANYKSQEAIDKWWTENGEAKRTEAVSKTALDGTWGEILCIGFAVNDGPVLVLNRKESEAELLSAFATELPARCLNHVRSGHVWEAIATWIGHNVQDFDLRFIWQRSRINGVRLPFSLPIGKPSYGKGPYVYDTMREWAGWKGHVKQTDLELAFGITRVDPLTTGGAEVYAAYKDGRLQDIEEHCRQDVTNLRQIYRRMT